MKLKDLTIIREGFTLMSGNVIAQALVFVSYLVVTRLFSPEDIGIYNIFYSYIEVLIIFSTGKYELATVLAKDDREAMAVAGFSMRLNGVVSLVLLLLVPIASILFADRFPGATCGESSYMVWLMLMIPFMVFFCGTSRVYTSLFNRRRDYFPISLSEVVGATTGVVSKIAMGFLGHLASIWGTLGLPLGTVIGKAASNMNYVIRVKRLGYPADVSKEERKAAASKYRNFPLYTMPKDLVNSLSYNLPMLWLAIYFDKAEVGLYALALTLVFRPVNILNTVFEKLLNVRVAEKVRRGERVMCDIVRFFAIVNIVALPVAVVAYFWGGDIFAFLFGGRWAGCGYYIRCLLPWTFILLTSSSLGFVPGLFNRQRAELVFYLLLLLFRVGAVVTGLVTHSFRLGVLLFAVSGAVVTILLLLWYGILVRRYESSIIL